MNLAAVELKRKSILAESWIDCLVLLATYLHLSISISIA